MSMLNFSKIWLWLRSSALASKDTWVATLLATVFSSGLVGPIYSGYVAKKFTIDQEKRDADRRAVDRFRIDADAFQTFSSAFVVSVTRENKVDRLALERLIANLQSQKISLDDAARKLPTNIQPQIERYEQALLALNAALGQVRDIETMKEFWERASDLLVVRQDLYRLLDVNRA